MTISQSQHIRTGMSLYDILGRVYTVKNYFLQYLGSDLIDVYLDLRNEFGEQFQNIKYNFLYFSLEELNDAELSFHNWCCANYVKKSNKLYSLSHEDLHFALSNFVEGYYYCYENFRNQKMG